ncbi:hypothetical protein GCM10023339_47900 [Alloalcanivorax gelatiniphagus]
MDNKENMDAGMAPGTTDFAGFGGIGLDAGAILRRRRQAVRDAHFCTKKSGEGGQPGQ